MQGNGDYISRKTAAELLSQPTTMSMCLSVAECHHKIAQQRIDRYLVENIPAADVRPNVPGHWIYKPYKVGGMNINFPSCSECGYSPFVSMYYAVEDMHFCPNCGADMRPEPPKEAGEGSHE